MNKRYEKMIKHFAAVQAPASTPDPNSIGTILSKHITVHNVNKDNSGLAKKVISAGDKVHKTYGLGTVATTGGAAVGAALNYRRAVKAWEEECEYRRSQGLPCRPKPGIGSVAAGAVGGAALGFVGGNAAKLTGIGKKVDSTIKTAVTESRSKKFLEAQENAKKAGIEVQGQGRVIGAENTLEKAKNVVGNQNPDEIGVMGRLTAGAKKAGNTLQEKANSFVKKENNQNDNQVNQQEQKQENAKQKQEEVKQKQKQTAENAKQKQEEAKQKREDASKKAGTKTNFSFLSSYKCFDNMNEQEEARKRLEQADKAKEKQDAVDSQIVKKRNRIDRYQTEASNPNIGTERKNELLGKITANNMDISTLNKKRSAIMLERNNFSWGAGALKTAQELRGGGK